MATFLIFLLAISSALVVAAILSARHDRPQRPPTSHHTDPTFRPPALRR